MSRAVFTAVSAEVSRTNALIVHVKVCTSLPGTVRIAYENAQAGAFVSAASSQTGREHQLDLARLRPETTYTYRALLVDCEKRERVSETASFTTGRLPARLATSLSLCFSGPGRFSEAAGVVVLCVAGVQCTSDFFQGYVGLDQDAQIVWYYESPPGVTPAAGDFYRLRDGSLMVTRGYALGLPNAESGIRQAPQMQIIDAAGRTLHLQPLVCSARPAKIGQKGAVLANIGWSHASYQDPATGLVHHLGQQLRDPFFDAGLAPAGKRMQLGATVRTWDPATGHQEVLTSDFRLLDPLTYRGTLSNQAAGAPVDCRGASPGLENQDWTHGNAISRLGGRANVFISQRNTSAVLVVDPCTHRLLYKFGPTAPSDFRFVRPNDLFYNQHDAHELPGGSVLMFDDGTTRPASQGGKYARAVEYRLAYWPDQTIRKVWEFRPRVDLECQDVGSARRLRNGNTLVDFGASNLTVKHVIEAGPRSNSLVADLEVATQLPDTSWLLYRAVPVDSIAGETRVPLPRPCPDALEPCCPLGICG